MNDKPLTGVRKRLQIKNTQQQMLLFVAGAAVVVAVCIVVAINLIQRISYQGKVNGELNNTNRVLEANIAAFPSLQQSVDALQTNSTLLALRNQPTDLAAQVVLDALPTVNDGTSLGASLQAKILTPSGVTIQGLSMNTASSVTTTPTTTGTATSTANNAPPLQTISTSFTLVGGVEAITEALQNLEKSIRPFTINTITLQSGGGQNGQPVQIQASINATSYYAAVVDFGLGSKEVAP